MSTRKKVDTTSLFSEPPATTENETPTRPKTAMGSLLDKGEQTVDRVQAIELHIDPKVIRPWKLHDRDDSKLNEEDCADIIESVKAIGQKDPIKVRPLVNDPDGYQYEIIKGRRRTFACSVLGKKVLARAEEMDDQAAWLEMDSENDDRKDISEMERARSYVEALNAGLFDTPVELAQRRGKPKSHVSKYVIGASILEFKAFMDMVDDFTEIPVMPSYTLMSYVRKGETQRKQALNRLQKIRDTGKELAPKNILSDLNKSLKELSKQKGAKPAGATEKHAVVKGDLMIMSAQKEKGGMVSVNADIQNASAAELKKAFAETLKTLGIK